MIATVSAILILAVARTFAGPVNVPSIDRRTVQQLNQAAFAEAQQRDASATRAFSSTEIKTSAGQCLFVDELSGDFRANLTPVQVGNCNGSTSQAWDIITSGKHNNVPGTMLVVNTLTQACLNFDGRGNRVILFSCGGRGDGSGQVTSSQLFPFSGNAGPLTLQPSNAAGTCFSVSGSILSPVKCNADDKDQSFTIGNSSTSLASVGELSVSGTTSVSSTVGTDTSSVVTCGGVVTVTVTESVVSGSALISVTTSSDPAGIKPAIASATPNPQVSSLTPTLPISVSRAGGVLNPTAAAEANVRDDTATRALSAVSLKSANGQCLFINPAAGDFRENLIPVQLADCSGSPNEKFDFITAGKHNNVANSTLVVSSLTQGCLNFDDRRAAGDTVIMFSCGGRADGGGQVTDSQLFPFAAGESTIRLAPENGKGAICLVPANGRLDSAPCSNDASQLFTIS